MKSKYIILTAITIGSLTFSCKKDKSPEPEATPAPTGPTYTVPTTYTFTNVNYSGQTTRLSMLTEMGTYMSTANTQGTTILASNLKNMFANSGNPFSDSNLNTSGKQLKNKCFYLDTTLILSYMDSIALCSQSTVAGANGLAGVVVSTTNSSKKYLQSRNGIEYGQLIRKCLMGSVFYYQAMESYICESGVGASVDNTTIVSGEGTAMEHHWDEGFGYFGAQVDFPTNASSALYWANYSNQVNAGISSNATMMNAFLKGRAAITNKDMTTKNEQINVIRDNWEKIVAGSALHELNGAKTNFSDDAVRNHLVSEALGFVMSLKYKSDKKISTVQLNQAIGYFGTNLYNISMTDIDNIRNLISSVYGLDSVKDTI